MANTIAAGTASATSTALNNAGGKRDDPFNGFNFTIECAGITVAGFKTCSGLDSSVGANMYREGSDPSLSTRVIPGLHSHSNLTLSRGLTTDSTLLAWHQEVANGSGSRADLTITLLDNSRVVARTWTVSSAMPIKWTGPSFDATSDAIAIESVEFSHEGIKEVAT